ncbi:MAG TPA: hypothetical protein VNJ53_05480 [Gaiellaceae bacterium]|nr:hypothetical protein [Gaiellaceae bacterium]
MRPPGHRPLCTLALVAEGLAERCPGEPCPFWERGCLLARIEPELAWWPELAGLLLGLRRELAEPARRARAPGAPDVSAGSAGGG